MTSDHDRLRGAHSLKTISEQLRALEDDLGRLCDPADARFTPGNRLPTSLGRPIGVASSVEFPSDASFSIGAHARTIDPAIRTSRGPSFGRTAAIAGASFALVATTAILPPLLWRPEAPQIAQQAPAEAEGSPFRTESFAHSAQGLGASAMSAQQPHPYTAHFVPAAGQGEAEIDVGTDPSRLRRQGRPAETSGWAQGAPATDQPPPWAPFGRPYSQ